MKIAGGGVDFAAGFFYAAGMFGKPRQVDTEEELYAIAVRALMRRAHSVHEMKKVLTRRSENELLVRVVMARLKENGQLDDARYAKQFARQRTVTRKQGSYRVARDLRARGVPDRHIEVAIADAGAEVDETAVVRARLERKLKSFNGEITENRIASMYRSLLRAGFPSQVIRDELRRVTRAEVAEVEAGEE